MYDLHRAVADLCLPQCPLKCMPARFKTINSHHDREVLLFSHCKSSSLPRQRPTGTVAFEHPGGSWPSTRDKGHVAARLVDAFRATAPARSARYAALLGDNADPAMAHSGPPLHIGQAAASPCSVIPIPSSTT